MTPPGAPRNVADGAPFREAAKELDIVHENGRDGLSARNHDHRPGCWRAPQQRRVLAHLADRDP
ncbi:MAG: hypothetical protein OXF27_05140 [Acidobacteria bacterium]|nr:hypothetical protein [Acidobacteriota bacterium]